MRRVTGLLSNSRRRGLRTCTSRIGRLRIAGRVGQLPAGWSPSTNGAVRGPVVGVVFEKVEDLEQYKGKLKGAIVLFGRPRKMVAPEFPLATPWSESTIPLAHAVNEMPID